MLFNTQNRDLLIKAFQNEAIHTSYCFFGDEGVGKTTTALEFASFLETGNFNGSALLDAKIFSENEKGSIGIDEARAIKEFCSTRPLKSPYRVAIIRYAESMTDHAQSALLKLFEEPNEHALIIVIARNKDILFPPLLSRMNAMYFARLSKKQVVDFLVKNERIAGSIAEKVAECSMGSIGRALQLIREGQPESDDITTYIEKEIERLYVNGSEKNAKVLSRLLKKEVEIKQFSVNGALQKKAIQQIESTL